MCDAMEKLIAEREQEYKEREQRIIDMLVDEKKLAPEEVAKYFSIPLAHTDE